MAMGQYSSSCLARMCPALPRHLLECAKAHPCLSADLHALQASCLGDFFQFIGASSWEAAGSHVGPFFKKEACRQDRRRDVIHIFC